MSSTLLRRSAGIPIGRKPTHDIRGIRPAAVGKAEGLVLVGHGSRCLVSENEMQAIGALVAAAAPDIAVEVGFLEMTDPPAGDVIEGLVRAGCRRIVVLPLVLLGAGHAKNDVPAIVRQARHRHPGVEMVFGSPLGVGRDLVEMLGGAIRTAGGEGLPLLVVARGTSDPDANGEACKAGRLIGEWVHSAFIQTGFSGVTGPSVAEALAVFEAMNFVRMAVAFWFLCNGKLVESAREDLGKFSERSGIEVLDAGYLGADSALVPLVLRRYREALGGLQTPNCDTCSYRAPWPGSEDRVGQAVGVGHSHLAEEHRHRHA